MGIVTEATLVTAASSTTKEITLDIATSPETKATIGMATTVTATNFTIGTNVLATQSVALPMDMREGLARNRTLQLHGWRNVFRGTSHKESCNSFMIRSHCFDFSTLG